MRSPDEIDIHDDDLTTQEAAQLAGVEAVTVRMWANRGHLPVHHRDERGWPRYRALDVAKAEAATRRHAGRP